MWLSFPNDINAAREREPHSAAGAKYYEDYCFLFSREGGRPQRKPGAAGAPATYLPLLKIKDSASLASTTRTHRGRAPGRTDTHD